MGRKRFITNDISIDGKVGQTAEVNPIAGLMWPWFLTSLDDWARITGNTREIKSSVFQNFPYTPEDLQAAIDLYTRFKLMHLYEVDGKPYLQANPQAFYALNTYIQKSRQEHDSSKMPPPPNHPWGRYWPTSTWPRDTALDEGIQQKAALSADKLQKAAKSCTSPSPSPSLSPSLIESEEEKEEECVRELPDELRANWGRAYQFLFVRSPSPAYISSFEKFQRQAGITDQLIVAVLEKAIETKRRHILAWAETVLSELVPYGVTTPEEWTAFETERTTEEAKIQASRKPKTAGSRNYDVPLDSTSLELLRLMEEKEGKEGVQ